MEDIITTLDIEDICFETLMLKVLLDTYNVSSKTEIVPMFRRHEFNYANSNVVVISVKQNLKRYTFL